MKVEDAIKKLEDIKKRNPNAIVDIKVKSAKYWVSRTPVVSYRKKKKDDQ